MNLYLSAALLFAIVLLQSTVMPAAMIGPVPPLLTVLAVVVWGIQRGPYAALAWALGLGALLDLVSPQAAGFYTLPMLAVAGVVALGRLRMFETHPLLPIGLTVLATVAYGVTQYALLGLRVEGLPWDLRALLAATLPVALLNLLWLPVVYLPLRALARRSRPPRMEWGR